MSCLSRVRTRLRLFRSNERGVVAIIFAIAVLPIMGLVGAAVDYGTLTLSKEKVDMIVDSSILAALSRNSMSGTASASQKQATDFFNTQKQNLPASVTITSLSVSVNDSAGKRFAVINYTAQQTTIFGALYGLTTMPFSGDAKAEVSLDPFIDFHLLLDNTPSMGIGATQSDINKLLSSPTKSCAFACHAVSPLVNIDPTEDNYTWAVKNGVTLRIDVLRSATQALMDKVSSLRRTTDQFQIAIHTFGNECTNDKLTTLSNLSTNLSALRNAASGVQLMTVNTANYVCTDYYKILGSMNGLIANPGDGSTAKKAQKVLFFVSDGVHDTMTIPATGCSGTIGAGIRCQEPINLSLCKMIKDRGIKIAVLYTTYLPILSDEWYLTMIDPFQPQIARTMQNCASPGLYYEVSPSQGISDAMNALFQRTVSQARLTQ